MNGGGSEEEGAGLRWRGGVIRLRRQHKATNMASFPVVGCASSQASFHYSSERRLVEDELPAGADSSESERLLLTSAIVYYAGNVRGSPK